MIKLMVLCLASFDLFLVVCYLILLWEKDIRCRLGILCTKSSPNQCNEQNNQNYQNHKGYCPKHCISPRMLIKPILNNSQNYNESYKAYEYCQGSILLFFRHAISFFPKICIRVYRLFRRCQPKTNGTASTEKVEIQGVIPLALTTSEQTWGCLICLYYDHATH
jgi:hypothetical protein